MGKARVRRAVRAGVRALEHASKESPDPRARPGLSSAPSHNTYAAAAGARAHRWFRTSASVGRLCLVRADDGWITHFRVQAHFIVQSIRIRIALTPLVVSVAPRTLRM